MGRRLTSPDRVGVEPHGIEALQRIPGASEYTAFGVDAQADRSRAVAGIDLDRVERRFLDRSQTRIGAVLEIADFSVNLAFALVKVGIRPVDGIAVHLRDRSFQ